MKIVVDGYGVFLGVKNGMVRLKKDGVERVFPAGNVKQIVIASGGVSISSSLLRMACENNINIVVLDSNGLTGIFNCLTKKANVTVRKEQYRAQNDERAIFLARCFLRGKMMNQYYLLKSFVKNRKRKDLLRECYEIKRRAGNLEKYANQQELIGEEAKAAEIYWRGISNFLDFDGKRRKRYDNPDAFNMALNYGYTILMSQVMLAVNTTNLDPYAGFLHAENPRRPSLVVDLMEEFRQPIVDRAVFKIVPEEKDGFLTKKSRRDLITAINRRLETKVTFNGRRLPIEYHMYLQARRIERFLVGKERYTPFILR